MYICILPSGQDWGKKINKSVQKNAQRDSKFDLFLYIIHLSSSQIYKKWKTKKTIQLFKNYTYIQLL